MDSAIAGSMNDNINMDNPIAGSTNDNINMDNPIAGSMVFVCKGYRFSLLLRF
jgi:hypothetical protein